jgi:hypothetical protein
VPVIFDFLVHAECSSFVITGPVHNTRLPGIIPTRCAVVGGCAAVVVVDPLVVSLLLRQTLERGGSDPHRRQPARRVVGGALRRLPEEPLAERPGWNYRRSTANRTEQLPVLVLVAQHQQLRGWRPSML